jgi:hypothetical protein
MGLHVFCTKCNVMYFHLPASLTAVEQFNGIRSNLICGSEISNIANIFLLNLVVAFKGKI